MKKCLYIFLCFASLSYGQTEFTAIKLKNDPATINDTTQVDLLVRENAGANKGMVRKIAWPYLAGIFANGLIPISGTAAGSPVTGDIEFSGSRQLKNGDVNKNSSIYLNSDNITLQSLNFVDNNTYSSQHIFSEGIYQTAYSETGGASVNVSNNVVQFTSHEGSYGGSILVNPTGVTVIADNPTSKGIRSEYDFTSNIGPLDYVQKKYCDDNFIPYSGAAGDINLGTHKLAGNGLFLSDYTDYTNGIHIRYSGGSTDQYVFFKPTATTQSIAYDSDLTGNLTPATVTVSNIANTTSMENNKFTVSRSSDNKSLLMAAGLVTINTNGAANRNATLQASNVTANRVIELPDASGTLATTAYADSKVQAIIFPSTTLAPSGTAVLTELGYKVNNHSSETIAGVKTFSASPIIPTVAAGDNSTKAASTAYADRKVADTINDGVIATAPSENAVFDALASKLNIGGDTTGAAMVIGSNDAQTVSLEYNNNNVISITSASNVTIPNGASLGNASSTTRGWLLMSTAGEGINVRRNVSDAGAALVAVNQNASSTGNIVSFSSNIAGTTAVRAGVTKTGNMHFQAPGNGMVLTSPDGTKYLVTVDDSGMLQTAAVTTP